MENDIKVSVIVPVYNAEKYLEQCLDSIVNQTLKEIEIICVDDGSTDSSMEILNRFKENDPRITVLSQQNLFAGVARNNGKSHARGKYLVFWDSDDYFYETALEKMYSQCEKDDADLCVCGGNQFLEDLGEEVPAARYVNVKRLPETIPFSRTTNPERILNFTTEAPWNKMFLRSFIEEEKLDFQGIRNGNDVFFVESALCLAKRITVVPEPLVCYRKNQSTSLVGTLHKSPLTPFRAWCDTRESLIKKDAFPEKSFVNKFLGSMLYLLRNLSTWDAYMEAWRFLKEEGGMEKLSIKEQPKDYYVVDWHYDVVEHLLNDSAEDFHAFLSYLSYNQMITASAKQSSLRKKLNIQKEKVKSLKADAKENKAELKNKTKEFSKLEEEVKKLKADNAKLNDRIDKLKSSMTYKVGSVITWLPRKIKK